MVSSIAVIDTAASRMLTQGATVEMFARKPDIMADAAYVILCKDSSTFTGNFCMDDEVLANEGVTDFKKYSYVESKLKQ